MKTSNPLFFVSEMMFLLLECRRSLNGVMKTKEEISNYCRNLLHDSMLNYPLRKEDANFLISYIFPLHEKYQERIGTSTIKSVMVHIHPDYKNRKCFVLVLDNNKHVDMSFVECIYRRNLREDIESACCSAVFDNSRKTLDIIKDWIKTLELGEITAGLGMSGLGTSDVKFGDLNLLANFLNYYNGQRE